MMWQRAGRSPLTTVSLDDFYQDKEPENPKAKKVAKKGRSRK
jgi:hypothetical protein